MKKILQFMLGLIFIFSLTSLFATTASADDNDYPTARRVIVHYHRWDGEYAGRNIWTWNTGTNGSEAPVAQSGTSDFGATFTIHIDDDAGAEIGLILRYGDAWGNGQNDRDGLIPEDGGDKANKGIIVKVDGEFDGFDEDGYKHVFVIEGMNEVIYQDSVHGPLRDGFGTLMIVYYDPAESYDGWNIWTWNTGTDGSEPANDTGVPFAAKLDVDGGTVGQEMFRVAFMSIAPDASDEVGFIVRTDAWAKQWDEDLLIDVTAIKGSGLQSVFYIGDSDEFYDDFASFEAVANMFEVTTAEFQDLNSLLIEFNKPVQVAQGEDNTSIFDASWFKFENRNGNTVAVSNISYEQGVNAVSRFMLIFTNELTHAAGPYTLTFQNDPEGLPTVLEVALPSEAPTITIIGSTNVTLELGDRYSLPTFRAAENFYGENVPIYTARVKAGHGYLSTQEAGIYEIVLTATDRFGNVAEETITVTVIDPCDDQAHLGTYVLPVSLFLGLPLAAIVFFKKDRRVG